MLSIKNIVILKRKSVLSGIMITAATGAVLIGHGCSDFKPTHSTSASQSTSTDSSSLGGQGQDFTPKQNTKTASLIYSKLILDNYVMCSGIKKPTFKTADVWNRKKGTVSEFGYATSVTSPMMMSIATIAGEVCNQLIEQESAVDPTQRRIFTGINFTAPGVGYPRNLMGDSIRRLARSCWQRNEDDAERELILNTLDTSMAGATGANNSSRNVALMTCTAMLSSLSALEM